MNLNKRRFLYNYIDFIFVVKGESFFQKINNYNIFDVLLFVPIINIYIFIIDVAR